MLSTLCVIWCIVRRRHLTKWRALLCAAAVCAALMLAFTLGYYAFLHRLVSYLPPFRSFRCPCRYDLLMQLELTIFVAAAVNDLFRCFHAKVADSSWRGIASLFLPAALSAAILLGVMVIRHIFAAHAHLVSRFSDFPDLLYGFVLATLATLFFILAARGRTWALYPPIALSVLDLAGHWWPTYAAAHPLVSISQWLSSEVADAPNPVPGRLLTAQDGDYPYMLAGYLKHGYPLSTGYSALIPAKRIPLLTRERISDPDDPAAALGESFDSPSQAAARRLASVTYLHPLKADGSPDLAAWARCADTLPRVRLVTQAVASKDVLRDLARTDIARIALIDRPIALGPAQPGSAAILVDRPGRIEVTTSAPTRQLLVLSESYYPGWQIIADGNTVLEDIPVYGDYQGCVVPAGAHHLVFTFAPASFDLGKRPTYFGIACATGLCLGIRSVGKIAGAVLDNRVHSER